MERQLISKVEAKEKGLKHYFTGVPCVHGGVALRYVVSGICKCDTCSKISSDYKREHRQQNKAAYSARDADYRILNKQMLSDGKKACYQKNKVHYRNKQAAYYRSNTALFREYGRRYTATKLERTTSWFGEFDEFVIREAFRLAKLREKSTSLKWHVDHAIPLKCKVASGLHCGANTQVIPEYVNCAKKNRMIFIDPLSWMAGI